MICFCFSKSERGYGFVFPFAFYVDRLTMKISFLPLRVVHTHILVGCNNKFKSMHSVLVQADLVLESDPELVYSMLDSIILPESSP